MSKAVSEFNIDALIDKLIMVSRQDVIPESKIAEIDALIDTAGEADLDEVVSQIYAFALGDLNVQLLDMAVKYGKGKFVSKPTDVLSLRDAIFTSKTPVHRKFIARMKAYVAEGGEFFERDCIEDLLSRFNDELKSQNLDEKVDQFTLGLESLSEFVSKQSLSDKYLGTSFFASATGEACSNYSGFSATLDKILKVVESHLQVDGNSVSSRINSLIEKHGGDKAIRERLNALNQESVLSVITMGMLETSSSSLERILAAQHVKALRDINSLSVHDLGRSLNCHVLKTLMTSSWVSRVDKANYPALKNEADILCETIVKNPYLKQRIIGVSDLVSYEKDYQVNHQTMYLFRDSFAKNGFVLDFPVGHNVVGNMKLVAKLYNEREGDVLAPSIKRSAISWMKRVMQSDAKRIYTSMKEAGVLPSYPPANELSGAQAAELVTVRLCFEMGVVSSYGGSDKVPKGMWKNIPVINEYEGRSSIERVSVVDVQKFIIRNMKKETIDMVLSDNPYLIAGGVFAGVLDNSYVKLMPRELKTRYAGSTLSL